MSENDPKPPANAARSAIGATLEDVTLMATAIAWRNYRFAPDWFADAIAEARKPCPLGSQENLHPRRREIVFAVCCAESYIYEWTLHEVLTEDPNDIRDYFPVKIGKTGEVKPDRRPLTKKYEDVPALLLKNRKISASPIFDEPHYNDWKRLIRFRNGLVHANASRPDIVTQEEKDQPDPPFDELLNMPAGWAVGVVITRIRGLHRAVGTQPPDWLVEP